MEKEKNNQEERKVFSNLNSVMNKSISDDLTYIIPEIHKRATALITATNQKIEKSQIILNIGR